jgi:aminoglycoside phosphotransferase (APT) family kinase protein
VTLNTGILVRLEHHLAEAWPGTTLDADPIPLAGGFWAAMYRVHLRGQPSGVPDEVVVRIAPHDEMGAKELAVQRTVADQGFATPPIRLAGGLDTALGGTWSVMDFAPGTSPIGDLDGLGALRRAPALWRRLPCLLAEAMASLHALDPEPASQAVAAAAPTVAWGVDDLLEHFAAAAEVLGHRDLQRAVAALGDRRPPEGRSVICHGDLHPFNVLVDDGQTTVIDWTAAVRAEPAYDVAFTSLLLANPPMSAPRPLDAVIGLVGRRLARRFTCDYRRLAPTNDLSPVTWYQALHGTRLLLDSVSHQPAAAGHPFAALADAAASAVEAATGVRVTAARR